MDRHCHCESPLPLPLVLSFLLVELPFQGARLVKLVYGLMKKYWKCVVKVLIVLALLAVGVGIYWVLCGNGGMVHCFA